MSTKIELNEAMQLLVNQLQPLAQGDAAARRILDLLWSAECLMKAHGLLPVD
jgi:hypothetical protein